MTDSDGRGKRFRDLQVHVSSCAQKVQEGSSTNVLNSPERPPVCARHIRLRSVEVEAPAHSVRDEEGWQ
jgi:hypothetical protein